MVCKSVMFDVLLYSPAAVQEWTCPHPEAHRLILYLISSILIVIYS